MEKTCIKPLEDLTFDTVKENQKDFLKTLLSDKSNTICVDLSGVSQCDSAGLALLIEAKRLCRKYHKSFEIRQIPEKTRALAEFYAVESLLDEL